jgi:hypothetical protein
MTSSNRKTQPLPVFCRALLLSAGITFILSLLLGGALINTGVALPQALEWVIPAMLLDGLLIGLGMLIILLTGIPCGLLAVAAGTALLFLVKRQDLSGVVAYAEPQS